MSGQRLQTQFSKVFAHFSGKDSDTNLQDMAEIFSCTRRNARMVLSKMGEQGWLSWEPAVGRGKQSRLTFHRTDSDLQMKRVRKWVKDGKLDAALEELGNDAAKLAHLIQEQLGVSTQEGKQIIRLPYYRAFPCLNPAKPLRRSEQHLITQIFNGLTRFNDSTEEVEADLAHHWEALSDTHWRFYLRPAVRFHDGSLLQTDDVIWSLQTLSENVYFSHIDHIVAPEDNVIDFYLNRPDRRLPDTLAVPMASIQSKKAATSKNGEQFPVGTGPYRVVENNSHQLVLKAHDQYFGFRALTDEIEIWVLDSAAMCYLQPTATLDPTALDSRQGILQNGTKERLALDEGCNYLMLNRCSGVAKDPRWAAYLSDRLSSLRLLPYLAESGIGEYRLTNAYGLLPGWIHTNVSHSDIAVPSSKTTLRLAHQSDNPLFPLMAKALKALLAKEGVGLDIDVVSYEDMMEPKQAKKVDIWLCGMSLGNKRSDAILPWLMNFEHLSAAMPQDEFSVVVEKMTTWRDKDQPHFDAETIGKTLVGSAQIIPLFHIWLGVVDGRELEDVSSNKVGWFDFKSVWKKPAL
ncbi:ABC transporter substrate-binding protein [Enterovibrio norvegicus FF-454]|uniref:ABC transporter substrate-binding protein n=1 Tax=Enterovibrio norvegicus FF-454 TaxID=1185651 RepID=A0A1E5CCA6_9GAMM|nr:SgrR family transcriptional regulator [Enterovibrio norvegicus]OEE63067.1 ABC transporter substrate-binding protein [Enterovibrio norvegicus FF-454]